MRKFCYVRGGSMTRAEKITELYNYCNIHGCCEICKLEDLSLGCNFKEMAEKCFKRRAKDEYCKL